VCLCVWLHVLQNKLYIYIDMAVIEGINSCVRPLTIYLSLSTLFASTASQPRLWHAAEWRHLARVVKNVLAAYAAAVLLFAVRTQHFSSCLGHEN